MEAVDYITLGIAVAGFLLSIYNFVEKLVDKSRRITVLITNVCRTAGNDLILMTITNRSHLGISLTWGEIAGTKFGVSSKTVFTFAHPELAGKATIQTVIFPIQIDPLASVQVLVLLEHDRLPLPSPCKVRFGSSRGEIRKTLCPPATPDDFLTLLSRLK